ncbi:MAG: AMP-binding protein [Pseudomonadota bacterium]
MPSLTSSSIVSVIGAIIADELNRKQTDSGRHQRQYLQGRQWSGNTIITTDNKVRGQGDEVVVDSFEWMSIAGRVVEFFQIASSGLEDYLLRSVTLDEWAQVVLTSRDQASKDITFSSSGTTGQPQKQTHSWDSLLAEVEFFAGLLQQHQLHPERFISVVPAHHIYGFIFSVLLPERLDTEVVRGLKAFTVSQAQQLQDHDAIIAFPGWYQQLAERGVNFPVTAFAVNSSGPASQAVLQTLQQRGLAAVLEVYGSSETSGLGYRLQRNGWYRLLPRWQRHDEQQLLDTDSNQYISLPDIVAWCDEFLFRPLKRADQAVQVNGVNVYPARIAALIEQHPQVKAARVRLLSDSDYGLKALLIVNEACKESEKERLLIDLPGWLSDKLQPHEIPKNFTIADQVPTNEMGKEQDWEVE